jgi:hypothetical protein
MPVIDGYQVYTPQTITTRLSMAISLVDDYTGKQPDGKVKVFLKGKKIKSIKNPSGYYLFLDLPEEEYIIRVEASHYFEVEIPGKPAELDPLAPVLEVKIKPKPSYTFPTGATLIRGMVRDVHEKPVEDAEVEVVGIDVSNRTSEKGEFVLYFKALGEDNLVNKKFVKGIMGKKLRLKATQGSKIGFMDLEQVEEGKTTVLQGDLIIT